MFEFVLGFNPLDWGNLNQMYEELQVLLDAAD